MVQSVARFDPGAPVPAHRLISEDSLVGRARALDQTALTSIFDMYYPKIYKYGLVQLREVEAAEDLASDVMLRVIESIPRYRSRGVPFSAWVYRIARNRLVDMRRRRNKRREVGLSDSLDIGDAWATQAAVDRTLDHRQLCTAISRLTVVQEQVIVLRFMKDLDVATVAKILGRSESAVKSLQFRALTSLRRILQNESRITGERSGGWQSVAKPVPSQRSLRRQAHSQCPAAS